MPREPVSSPRDVSADVLLALALPSLDSLTPDQRRGAVCVWGTTVLSTQTAYDLGEREDQDGRLFPRGCAPCTAAAARQAFRTHSRWCVTCERDEELCYVHSGLRRLALDARARAREVAR